MKRVAVFMLLAGVLAAQEVERADRAAILDTLVCYVRAVSHKDRAAYAAAAEPGASLGLPHVSLWPPKAVERQFFGTARWSGAGINFTLAPHTFRWLSSDTVIVDGRFLHVGAKNHRPLGEPGQFMALLRRGGTSWKVAAIRMAGGPKFLIGAGLEPALLAHDRPVPVKQGWTSLFDGVSGKGWHAAGGGPFPPNWKVENGILKAMPDSAPVPASILTDALYTDFNLELEWRLLPGSNSGVKYRIIEQIPLEGGHYVAGSEFQIVDDDVAEGGKLPPDGRTGAFYDLLAPVKKPARPVGEWNKLRLSVHNGHVEHWLNGEKVVEYDVDQDFASPILLQNHGTEAWFRNIRIQAQ